MKKYINYLLVRFFCCIFAANFSLKEDMPSEKCFALVFWGRFDILN